MIHCINCGHVNAEGASQCEACFEALPAVTSCATCQATVPDDAFFCPQCGASLPRGVANQPDAPLPDHDVPQSAQSDLPPTNVVAQQSFGASGIPPTNVVSPLGANELPPTNVVHPVPETMPPQPPSLPSDLPPTNVVHPSPPEPEVGAVPSGDTLNLDESASENEIETIPTMVVSPSSDRDVADAPLPPADSTAAPPFVPPTVPPQAPPSYQAPKPELPLEESLTNVPNPNEGDIASTPDTLSAPTTEFMVEDSPPQSQSPNFTSPATTVQPSMPVVGETIIQKPPARMVHERTNTSITLPTNLDIVLVGKTTNSISPDVDVSGFIDSDVVSRRHAAIFVSPEGYFIEDLGSSNGTYVNDVPCTQGDRMPITSGDRICLGRENKVSFIFQIG